MSNSYFVDRRQYSSEDEKKDPLIFMVNDKGEIMADKVTLQTLMHKKDNTPISVVRVSNEGYTEGTLTLIVDPPDTATKIVRISSDSSISSEFSAKTESDQDEINKKQNSEVSEASDDNVTALLTMLTLEDEKNCMRYNIKWDHCYSDNHSKLASHELVPIVNKSNYSDINQGSSANFIASNSILNSEEGEERPKLYKRPACRNSGRPQRSSVMKNLFESSNSNLNDKKMDNYIEYDEFSFSPESFSSEESSSDSDFYQKRSKEKKKAKRSVTKKVKNSTSFRQINLQNNRKSKKSWSKNKKNVKSLNQNIEDGSDVTVGDDDASFSSLPVEMNVLQTKNYVKANLISSNMFEGGMILTKPGQNRNDKDIDRNLKNVKNINSKTENKIAIENKIEPSNKFEGDITLLRNAININDRSVEKKILNESLSNSENINFKKQNEVSKSHNVKSGSSKIPILKDIRIISNPIKLKKTVKNTLQKTVANENEMLVKPVTAPKLKLLENSKKKPVDEKKLQSNISTDSSVNQKPVVIKVKKESRKSQTLDKGSLEPDLFSTPDVIRRVNLKKGNFNYSNTVDEMICTTIHDGKNDFGSVTSKNLSPVKSDTEKLMEKNKLTNDLENRSKHDLIEDNLLLSKNYGENDNHLTQPVSAIVSNSTPVEKFPQTPLVQPILQSVGSENIVIPDENFGRLEETNKIDSDDEKLFASLIQLQESLKAKTNKENGFVLPEVFQNSNGSPSTTESSKNSLGPSVVVLKSETDSLNTTALSYSDENSCRLGEVDPMFSTKLSPRAENLDNSTELSLVTKILPVESQFLHAISDTSIVTDFSQSVMDRLISSNFSNKLMEQSNADYTAYFTSLLNHPENCNYPYSEIAPLTEISDLVSLRTTSVEPEIPVNNLEPMLATENIMSHSIPSVETELFQNSTTESTAEFYPKITSSPNREEIKCLEDRCSETDLVPKSEICVPSKSIAASPKKPKSVSKNLKKPAIKRYKQKPLLSKTQASNIQTKKKTDPTDQQLKTKDTNLEELKPKVEPITICLKSNRVKRKICHISTKRTDMVYDIKSIKKLEASVNSAEKEDPIKTYCICKLPEDGRLMITCDKCVDWFHIDCVKLEESEAKNIEKQGIQWYCPNCKKKDNKKESRPLSKNRKNTDSSKRCRKNSSSTTDSVEISSIGPISKKNTKKKFCARCNKKPARVNSDYCSDACIMEKSALTAELKSSTNLKKNSKVSAGSNTPRKTNRKQMSTKANNSRSDQDKKSTLNIEPQESSTNNQPSKKLEADPDMRSKVGENLAELLTTRLKDATDITLSKEEVTEIAVQIELEMFKFFKDTGAKYKSKYRSLVFNIKDPRNTTLYRRIAERSLTPETLVKLEPADMACEELAQWREKETKNQLEMIQKTELNELAAAKPVILKTHKGEQIIENNNSLEFMDSNASVKVMDTAINNNDIETSSLDVSKSTVEGIKLAEETIEKKQEKKNVSVDEKQKNRDKEMRSKKSHGKISHRHSKDKKEESRKSHKHKHKDKDYSKDEVKDRNGKIKDRSSDKKHKRDDRHRSRDKHKKHRDRSRDRSKSDRRKHRHKSNRERDENQTEENKKDKEKKKEEPLKIDNEKCKQNEEHENKNIGQNFLIPDELMKNMQKIHADVEIKDCPNDDLVEKIHADIEIIDCPNVVKLEVSNKDKSYCINKDSTTPVIDLDEGVENELLNSNVNHDITHTLPKNDMEIKFSPSPKNVKAKTVWRGIIKHYNNNGIIEHYDDIVLKVFVSAQSVSNNSDKMTDVLPDCLNVDGKIAPSRVWEYIENDIKKENFYDIIVIRLTPISDDEMPPYNLFYQNLKKDEKLAVIKTESPTIKDMYLMALSSVAELPPLLQLLSGSGLDKNHKNILLGIAILKSKKRASNSIIPPCIPEKISRKENLGLQQMCSLSKSVPDESPVKINEAEDIDLDSLKISPELSKSAIVKSSNNLYHVKEIDNSCNRELCKDNVHIEVFAKNESILLASLDSSKEEKKLLHKQCEVEKLNQFAERDVQVIQNISSRPFFSGDSNPTVLTTNNYNSMNESGSSDIISPSLQNFQTEPALEGVSNAIFSMSTELISEENFNVTTPMMTDCESISEMVYIPNFMSTKSIPKDDSNVDVLQKFQEIFEDTENLA